MQLQQILETPLLSPDTKDWKNEPRITPELYKEWLEAQLFSAAASEKWANFKEMIQPLNRTKFKEILETMWKIVNNVRNLHTRVFLLSLLCLEL